MASLLPQHRKEWEQLSAEQGAKRQKLEDALEERMVWDVAALYANGPNGSWVLGNGRDSRELAAIYERELCAAFQRVTGSSLGMHFFLLLFLLVLFFFL